VYGWSAFEKEQLFPAHEVGEWLQSLSACTPSESLALLPFLRVEVYSGHLPWVDKLGAPIVSGVVEATMEELELIDRVQARHEASVLSSDADEEELWGEDSVSEVPSKGCLANNHSTELWSQDCSDEGGRVGVEPGMVSEARIANALAQRFYLAAKAAAAAAGGTATTFSVFSGLGHARRAAWKGKVGEYISVGGDAARKPVLLYVVRDDGGAMSPCAT
jgi:hypothetical protein